MLLLSYFILIANISISRSIFQLKWQETWT